MHHYYHSVHLNKYKHVTLKFYTYNVKKNVFMKESVVYIGES